VDPCAICHSRTACRGARPPSPYPGLKENDWFDRALRDNLFTSWFQPVIDLSSGVVFAHECLIRLEGNELKSGADIVNAAFARGQIHEFDSWARQLAIREGALRHEAGTYLFINFFPSSIYEPEYCLRGAVEALARTSLRASDVIFEVVDSENIRDLEHLRAISEFCRREGFGFALDNAGGRASMRLMSELSPGLDFVKIDRGLVRQAGMRAHAAIIRDFVELAAELHIAVIAEGVETAEMAALLQALGIYLMQGWHFGPPSPHMRSNTGAALARLMDQLGGRLEAETPHCFTPILPA